MSSFDNVENNTLSEKEIKESELSVNTNGTNSDPEQEENIKIDSENDMIINKAPYIGTLEDVIEFHEYNADNSYILRGYRIHFNTIGRVMKSLVMIHNETFNIWSHMLGCLAALFLLILTMCSLTKLELLHYFSKFTGFIVINFATQNNTNSVNYSNISLSSYSEIDNFYNNNSSNHTLNSINTFKSSIDNYTDNDYFYTEANSYFGDSFVENSSKSNISDYSYSSNYSSMYDFYSLQNLTLKRNDLFFSKDEEIQMLQSSLNNLTKEDGRKPNKNEIISMHKKLLLANFDYTVLDIINEM